MTILTHEFFAMGSECSICLDGLNFDRALEIAQAGEAEVRRIERRYSRFSADSDLARLNEIAGRGGVAKIDLETEALLRFSKTCWEISGGAFDVTSGAFRSAWAPASGSPPAPERLADIATKVGFQNIEIQPGEVSFWVPGVNLDFGGVGKEYAADRACEVCLEDGALHGFVNMAGDIRVIGPQADGAPWRFGVKGLEADALPIDVVSMTSGAVATSGDYERPIRIGDQSFSHFIDPRSGLASVGLASVTVIAATCLAAGSLATTAMVMGSAGADWLSARDEPFLAIDHAGMRWSSPPFRSA